MPIFNRHPKRKLAAIYGGGILGALVRVGMTQAFPHAPSAWPWPTFGVNMIGALLIGYLFASFRDHTPDRLHHPFFAIGICGTLTTFSTMQLELYAMVDHGRLGLAGLYCTGTLALGYLAVLAGMGIERLSLREARA